MPTKPPVSRIAANCLLVRFRECGLKACALEWVATSGALLIAATSQNPRSLRCERSIRIFNWLHADIQYILITRVPALTGRYEFLSFREPAQGRAWLEAIRGKVPSAKAVTDAVDLEKRWVSV